MTGARLTPPAWAATPAGVALLGALDAGAGTSRLVGGAVRDPLLGLVAKDIDLATRLRPDAVMARLAAAGLKAVPTGLAHGTVTAVSKGLVVEVTSLRRDVASFGRHAEIAFTDDWRADAGRRDFTINALYASLVDGEISDYFGGLDDLAARCVRFIGDPYTRIAEDHLRILRFFRFSARFAAGLDADGLTACAARANDLMALSRERIAQELRGLLLVADPLPTLTVMIDAGVFRPVLPEFGPERLSILARTIAAETATGQAADWRRRLAALLPPSVSGAEDVAARLRLANVDRARIGRAVRPWTDASPWQSAWSEGAESAIDRLLIAGETAPVAALAAWQRPRLPVSGRDVMARGLEAGPAVAAALRRFEAAWVAAGFPDDGAAVATMLDAAVAGG